MTHLNRRDFAKIFVGSIALCLAAPSAARAAVDGSDSIPFAEFNFGDLKNPELICIKGAGIDPSFEYDYSKYKMPTDINFYGGVQVSTPAYHYYNNKLFRITFTTIQKGKFFDRDLHYVISKLKDQYGVVVEKIHQTENTSEVHSWHDVYITSDGNVIDIGRKKINGSWSEAFVRIYDQYLVDGFCLDVNPDYIPRYDKLPRQ